MKLCVGLVALGLAAGCCAGRCAWGQQGDAGGLSASDVARRDALLEPGIAKMKAKDAAGAEADYGPALAAFPHDLKVLAYAAEAAGAAGDDAREIDLLTRALDEKPAQPWPLRLSRMQSEAKLARWAAFEADLALLRAAKKAGTDASLAKSNGFVIEQFEAGGVPVPGSGVSAGGGWVPTRCTGLCFRRGRGRRLHRRPVCRVQLRTGATSRIFRPYLDVESDDIDQVDFKKRHPEKVALGERSYSLDSYPGPCAQGLIKFYPEGEPNYEQVRGDVMAATTRKSGGTKP